MPKAANRDQGQAAKSSVGPYEVALNSAFQKLSSEVLIFLLAYTILLIGMQVFGNALALEVRTLLYVIPIVGVGAHVLLARKKAAHDGVSLTTGLASNSQITGVRGDPGKAGGTVELVTGAAVGGSKITGVDMSPAAEQSGDPGRAYLGELFDSLNSANRNKLIQMAGTLANEQQHGG